MFDKLAKALNITIKDQALYEVALTHRSYLNEHRRQKLEHNERLEFLGDAVLELVVTEYLYKNHKDPEGVLTNWRSALVKTESLAAVGENLGLSDFVRLSRGEAHGSERAKRQIMANTVEAVIGAMYLDQGYDMARQFIAEHIICQLPNIIASGSWQDAKTKLQETAQEAESYTPVYRVLSEEGPDHDKIFTVGVYVGRELRGQGQGSSKQAAQQAAAEKALDHYKAP